MSFIIVQMDRQIECVTVNLRALKCNYSIATMGVDSLGLGLVAVTNGPWKCVEFGTVIECRHTCTVYRVVQKSLD